MDIRVISEEQDPAEPQRFRQHFVRDLNGHYNVSVFVGENFAWCTCRDYWKGTTYAGRVENPQVYYGATVQHGCAHIDYVLGIHGYLDEAEPDFTYESPLAKRVEALEQQLVDVREAQNRQSIPGHVHVTIPGETVTATWV